MNQNIETIISNISSIGNSGDIQHYLEGLPHDELMEIKALMWLGRDFLPEEDGAVHQCYEALLKEAYGSHDQHTAAYIATKTPLPDYLRHGLELLNVNNEEDLCLKHA